MNKKYEQITKMYEESYRQHGDSSKSLLTPKGRQALRFRVVDEFLQEDSHRVLDYGCGLGYLYEYLLKKKFNVDYHGLDIMPFFIERCREKFKDGSHFDLIKPEQELQGEYDVVFTSGVFNIKIEEDEKVAKSLVFKRLKELFGLTESVMVSDFLSPYVDYQQEQSLHFEIGEIADFCCRHLTRRFEIRHSYLPYEFTLVAYKNDEILKPGNFFAADLSLEEEN